MVARRAARGQLTGWAGAVTSAIALGAGAAHAQHAISVDSIPGTLVTFELVAVPGGQVSVDSAGQMVTVEVAPFLIGRTEVTWDAYDVFAFRLDQRAAPPPPGADAVARPSRPYGAPDWGFGHRGYPAMSVTREAAQAYCVWLSAKTGRRYRLPTEAEWAHAAALAYPSRAVSAEGVGDRSWGADNADGRTHPVGTRVADALGLFDLLGNVAEWVQSLDGARIVRGGSYRDAGLTPEARAKQNSRWNETDPQIPKSTWWLSDGPFVGIRIVREH